MIEHHVPLDGRGLRITIIASRFNDAIVRNLLDGALHTLRRLGVDDDAIELAWVPGAFELPLAAQAVARTGRCDAVICLGAVIRGATAHFDIVAAQTAAGIARVATETGIPIIFGVLTTNTTNQAIERAGTKAGNKGTDAAVGAIEMARLMPLLRNDKHEQPE